MLVSVETNSQITELYTPLPHVPEARHFSNPTRNARSECRVGLLRFCVFSTSLLIRNIILLPAYPVQPVNLWRNFRQSRLQRVKVFACPARQSTVADYNLFTSKRKKSETIKEPPWTIHFPIKSLKGNFHHSLSAPQCISQNPDFLLYIINMHRFHKASTVEGNPE